MTDKEKNRERALIVRRRWRAKNKEKIVEYAKNHRPKYRERPGVREREREREYFRKYGITLEQKKQRLKDQGNKCGNPGCDTVALDGGRGQGRGWNTDHDHRNLKLRGELCPNCNKALGMVYDKVERLEGLIQYLHYWREQHTSTSQHDGIIGKCKNR